MADDAKPDVRAIKSYWDCPNKEANEDYDPETSDCTWSYQCTLPYHGTPDEDRCMDCPDRTDRDGEFDPYERHLRP